MRPRGGSDAAPAKQTRWRRCGRAACGPRCSSGPACPGLRRPRATTRRWAGPQRGGWRRCGAPEGLQLPSVPITGVAAPPLESAELAQVVQGEATGRGSWEGSQDHRLGLMGREGGRIPARRAGRGGVFPRRAEAGGRERPGLCVFPLGPPLPEKQPSPFSEIEAPGAWLGLIAGSWAERGEPKSPDALQSSLTSFQRLGGEYASQPQF